MIQKTVKVSRFTSGDREYGKIQISSEELAKYIGKKIAVQLTVEE